MAESITGLDIGGAHLKAAQVSPAGRILTAIQVPCTLWLGLEHLRHALALATARLAPVGRVAITMTGELADLFPDRATGVARLCATVATAMPEAEQHVWAGRLGFLEPARVPGHETAVASANWLASATLAAERAGQGLFVDLGSTTTDILVMADRDVRAEGMTDRERLATGELVYTGLVRTPLMTLATAAPFAGRWVTLANELFATMADAHRLTGSLPEEADQHATADGQAKTETASAHRLARMIGADFADGSMDDWRRLAGWFVRRQQRRIEDAVALQESRGLLAADAPLVGAGCGRFLLERLADTLGRPYRDFASLLDVEPPAAAWASTCAPAVAVALLHAQGTVGRDDR